MQNQLAERRELGGHIYRLVARSIPRTGIALFDTSLRFLAVEGAWPSALELKVGEELPATTTLGALFSGALSGQTTEFDYPHGERTFQFHVVPIRDEAAAGMAVCRDVTLERAREQHLRQQAWVDGVTALKNRAGLLAVAQGLLTWRDVAVLAIDLDGFKAVNDSLGHPAGDEVLRVIGERLGACLRREDHAARFGGDEFVILLSNLPDVSEARPVAERLISSIREPIPVDGQEVVVTASIGLVMGRKGDSFEEVYGKADQLLLEAKSHGKNTIRTAV